MITNFPINLIKIFMDVVTRLFKTGCPSFLIKLALAGWTQLVNFLAHSSNWIEIKQEC